MPTIAHGVPVQYFPMTDGVAMGLRNKAVIYQTNSIIENLMVPYAIQLWAKEMIEADMSLIEDFEVPKFPKEDDWL